MSEPPTTARPDPDAVEPGAVTPVAVNPTAVNPAEARTSWINRRRERIVAEIQRNRRHEYRVPTWVLAATLAAIVGGYALLLILV